MLKRCFDICVSVVGLILVLPLFVVISVLIRLDSPGPVFYRARRIGRGGKPFTLYKFRTMVQGADRQGPGITRAADARVTRFGRVLRRTKWDELPQLLNVIKGDMSLVGPRPEDPRYVMYYTPEQREVLTAYPGITSLASIRFRHEEALLQGTDWETTYIQDVLPTKLQIDLEYVRHANLLNDIKVIFLTMLALARRA